MKSEYIANLELTPKQKGSAWMQPSTSKQHMLNPSRVSQHYKPTKQNNKVWQYLGALVIGLILSTPFFVQTITDYTK